MNLTDIEAGVAVQHASNGVIVASRFHVRDARVHAPDADDLTTAIDALEAWHRQGHSGSVSIELSEEERPILTASLPWLTLEDEGPHVVHRFDHGAAVLERSVSFDAAAIVVDSEARIPVDEDKQNSILEAWALELSEQNVSQGAYVSDQVHVLGLNARLGMQAQVGPMWPPRGSNADGSQPHKGQAISLMARVVSWTRLIAAGCPSEFSIRAPVLGGLTSLLVAFDDGPSGVFLYVDGHPAEVGIDDEVRLVVRRVYGQDGTLRYGRKAILL